MANGYDTILDSTWNIGGVQKVLLKMREIEIIERGINTPISICCASFQHRYFCIPSTQLNIWPRGNVQKVSECMSEWGEFCEKVIFRQ